MGEALELCKFVFAGKELLIKTDTPILSTLDGSLNFDQVYSELFDFLKPVVNLIPHCLKFLNESILLDYNILDLISNIF